MPTGYTASITDTTTLKEFVLRCARAMGALVTMRDEPWDAALPESFEPSGFYAKWVAQARANWERLSRMTPADVEAEMLALSQRAAEERARRHAEASVTKARYMRVLGMVEAWTPPTEEHRPFKQFMLEQLRESIALDCHQSVSDPAPILTPSEWLRQEIRRAHDEIVRASAEHAKEVARCESRTRWLQALQASLNTAESR